MSALTPHRIIDFCKTYLGLDERVFESRNAPDHSSPYRREYQVAGSNAFQIEVVIKEGDDKINLHLFMKTGQKKPDKNNYMFFESGRNKTFFLHNGVSWLSEDEKPSPEVLNIFLDAVFIKTLAYLDKITKLSASKA
jgi:retron-type reverse transcriptase